MAVATRGDDWLLKANPELDRRLDKETGDCSFTDKCTHGVPDALECPDCDREHALKSLEVVEGNMKDMPAEKRQRIMDSLRAQVERDYQAATQGESPAVDTARCKEQHAVTDTPCCKDTAPSTTAGRIYTTDTPGRGRIGKWAHCLNCGNDYQVGAWNQQTCQADCRAQLNGFPDIQAAKRAANNRRRKNNAA